MQLNSRQAMIVAFVVGLIAGLVVLGWGLFPVQWTNADPWDLTSSAKGTYLTMVAQTFITTRDVAAVQQRLQGWPRADLEKSLQNTYADYQRSGRNSEAVQIAALANSLQVPITNQPGAVGQATGQPAPGATPGANPAATPAAQPQSSTAGQLGRLLLYAVVLVALIAVAAGVYIVFGDRLFNRTQPQPVPAGRKPLPARTRPPDLEDEEDDGDRAGRAEETPTRPPTRTMSGLAPRAQVVTNGPPPANTSTPRGTRGDRGDNNAAQTVAGTARAAGTATATALGTFTAEYNLGDTDYDQSFGLEMPNGDYVGECGMGVAELMDGDTSRATAFEVWLFDKSDIRSVTRVVMSEHAFNEPSLHDKLSSKGDPLQAQAGTTFNLETASLRVQATIEDATYTNTSPANSSFSRLVVSLKAYKR